MCQNCGQQFTNKGKLARHHISMHEGIQYPCEHFDYQAARKDSVAKHWHSVHMRGGVIHGQPFTCEQCDYEARDEDPTIH